MKPLILISLLTPFCAQAALTITLEGTPGSAEMVIRGSGSITGASNTTARPAGNTFDDLIPGAHPDRTFFGPGRDETLTILIQQVPEPSSIVPLGTPITGDGSTIKVVDQTAATRRFYRVSVSLP